MHVVYMVVMAAASPAGTGETTKTGNIKEFSCPSGPVYTETQTGPRAYGAARQNVCRAHKANGKSVDGAARGTTTASPRGTSCVLTWL